MVWEGAGVVKSARKLIGATNPLEAEPGTIRGDFAIEVGRNVVHGSDSVDNGERETGEARRAGGRAGVGESAVAWRRLGGWGLEDGRGLGEQAGKRLGLWCQVLGGVLA